MAEFCLECFKSKLMTKREKETIKDEDIIMFDDEDFCECCGKIKPLVHYTRITL